MDYVTVSSHTHTETTKHKQRDGCSIGWVTQLGFLGQRQMSLIHSLVCLFSARRDRERGVGARARKPRASPGLDPHPTAHQSRAIKMNDAMTDSLENRPCHLLIVVVVVSQKRRPSWSAQRPPPSIPLGPTHFCLFHTHTPDDHAGHLQAKLIASPCYGQVLASTQLGAQ